MPLTEEQREKWDDWVGTLEVVVPNTGGGRLVLAVAAHLAEVETWLAASDEVIEAGLEYVKHTGLGPQDMARTGLEREWRRKLKDALEAAVKARALARGEERGGG